MTVNELLSVKLRGCNSTRLSSRFQNDNLGKAVRNSKPIHYKLETSVGKFQRPIASVERNCGRRENRATGRRRSSKAFRSRAAGFNIVLLSPSSSTVSRWPSIVLATVDDIAILARRTFPLPVAPILDH